MAQSVDGDVTSFVWDWVSGIPEMLSDGDNLYLVSHETLGQWDGAVWAHYLSDALGSIGRPHWVDTSQVLDYNGLKPLVRKCSMDTTPEAIVNQIDAIICELQGLRQTILVQTQPPNGNVTEQLYGALGQGSWDEYDLYLDWERFAS